MRLWLAGLGLLVSSSAGLVGACASSQNPNYFTDAGNDATQMGGDASDDGTGGGCGTSGAACCAANVCDQGLTCTGGTCTSASGEDGGGNTDTGSGADSGGDVNQGDDASQKEGGSGGDSGDAGGVDCGSTPQLYPDDAGSLYCGYQSGADLYCGVGKECCLGGYVDGGYAPQVCANFGKACPNGESYDAGGSPAIPIECAQISDCTADGVSKAVACCLIGATAPAEDGCSYPKSSDGTSISCETGSGGGPAKCKSGEVNVCSTQADCPTGTTCTAGKWKIFQIGFCM